MKPFIKCLACAIGVGALTACGGGNTENARQTAEPARLAASPRALAAAAQADATTVARMHQALFGKAPGNAAFVAATADASANAGAFAVNLATPYAAISDAAFAKLVLDNMGFTAYSVNSQAHAEISNLVTQLFAAYGPSARGAIVLNLANILAGLGGNATYGRAAALFNQKVAANLQYSSNPSNANTAVVGAGIFFLNYDSPNSGGFSGYDAFLEDGRYYGTDIFRDGRQNGQLAAHLFSVLGLSNSVAAGETVPVADFTDDPEKVGSFISADFGRTFDGVLLSAKVRIPEGLYSSYGTQITYTSGGPKYLYADPLPMSAIAGDYAGVIRSVGIQRPQTSVPTLTIGNDGTFTTTVNDCTFSGKLVPYGSSSVFDAQASASGANCGFTRPLTGAAIPMSIENGRPQFSIGLHSADTTQVATFIVTKK